MWMCGAIWQLLLSRMCVLYTNLSHHKAPFFFGKGAQPRLIQKRRHRHPRCLLVIVMFVMCSGTVVVHQPLVDIFKASIESFFQTSLLVPRAVVFPQQFDSFEVPASYRRFCSALTHGASVV
jgi:hypothetical protein